MRKKLLILIILLTSLVAKDFKNISLVDFVQILAQTTNKNIVMSDSIKKDFHIYLPSYNFSDKKLSLKLLRSILKLNDLSTKNVNDVILIYKPKIIPTLSSLDKPKPILNSYIFKFKWLSTKDLTTFFSAFYPDLKFSVLKHRLLFISTSKKHNIIIDQLSKLDSSYLQRNIKLTIVSTLNHANEDIGTDIKALSFNPNSYISLLTSRLDFQTSLSSTNQLYAVINLLKDKGLTTLLDNPNLTLSDKSDASIESTQNIPFLSSTSSTQDTRTTTQNSYDYKDVGLKVHFTNVTITKLYVDFDLDIFIQSILDNSITPVIGSRHVQTHVTLDRNSSVILGGLTSHLTYNSVSRIPIIEYIPVVNYLTKHKVSQKKDETFTIIITDK